MRPQGDYDGTNETNELISPDFGLQCMVAHSQDEQMTASCRVT